MGAIPAGWPPTNGKRQTPVPALRWRGGHRLRTTLRMYFGTLVPRYRPKAVYTMPNSSAENSNQVDRIQTGVRLEKRLVKVLKALAEYKEVTLGDLLEGIVLHAFEGKSAFSKETLGMISKLKEIYGLDFGAEASHRMSDRKRA